MPAITERKGKTGRITYRVQVRIQGHPPAFRTFQRRSDARLWAQQIEAAIRRGEALPTPENRKRLFRELADRYLQIVERRNPSALAKQRQIMEWWKRQLGHYYLANVTPAVIAERRDALLAEDIGHGTPRRRSAATANRYLAALSKAFSDASREWHWVNDNPVIRVSKEREPEGRVRFLSDDERIRLLVACRKSRLPDLELIVLLALTTGMRRGEIMGLRWRDVDINRKLAVLSTTKNRERRSVPLVPHVLSLFVARSRSPHDQADLVFKQAQSDKVIQLDFWFKEAMESAQIENFRFHDLRHTAASYLAMSGCTPGEIAAVLGHKTLQMVKRYAHLSAAHTASVVHRMAEKYFPDAKRQERRIRLAGR